MEGNNDKSSKLLLLREKCSNLINYMKFMANLVLIFLCLQNHFFTIISTPVLIPKVYAISGGCQIILFILLIHFDRSSFDETIKMLKQQIFRDIRSTFSMSLPPLFLAISTELFLLSSIIAPMETAFAKHFTILSIAIFSIVILKRGYFLTQILSIFFIVAGIKDFPQKPFYGGQFLLFDSLTNETIAIVGYVLIVSAVACYGLSYVLLEKNLKAENSSFWIIGIQYNIFAVPFFLIISIVNDQILYENDEFFHAFDIFAWFFIVFVTAQKIMELFVLKLTDGIWMKMSHAAAFALIVFLERNLAVSRNGTGLIIYGIMLYIVMEYFPKWGQNSKYNTNNDNRDDQSQDPSITQEVYDSLLQGNHNNNNKISESNFP